jgi:threonine dehydrogenase-like Zn-dependent dehydrogenase
MTSRTMRAVVFAGPGQLVIEDRAIPAVAADEVLLEVEACGICGTDLHIVEDPPGHPAAPGVILGHELVGHVVATGPQVYDLVEGARVVVSPNVSCWTCRNCKAGIFSACERFSSIGIFRDGALAEAVNVPARCCFEISEDVPASVAALTEPLSCVMNGVRQASPIPGEFALIYGAGAIGLLFLAVLTASGVRCIVSEPSPVRRATATQMGAHLTIDPMVSDFGADIAAVTRGGADIAIDAAGSRLADAIKHTRTGGRILLFGFNTNALPQIQQSEITRRELLIYGTWTGRFVFPDSIRLQESGLVDLTPLTKNIYHLEEAPAAFERLRSGDIVKAILTPR